MNEIQIVASSYAYQHMICAWFMLKLILLPQHCIGAPKSSIKI